MAAEWVDLLDPDEAEIRKHAPNLERHAIVELLRRPDLEGGGARPTFQGHGDYVFGILLLAVLDAERDLLFYQEVDLVIRRESILTVRKTPQGAKPFALAKVQEVCDAREHVPPG